MFLIRRLGSVFRGKATPFQVLLATTLGGMLGCLPGFFLRGHLAEGFGQSPGLLLLLLSLVLVLNANLALFALMTLLGKLFSIALLPVSYAIGRWLVDAMPQLFASLVNGRYTAWLGLEYYATTGGLVVGAAIGIACGLLVNRLLARLRVRMADAEQNSERYQRYAGKWWVRLLAFVFLGGGKGKKLSWQQLAAQKGKGLPIRIPGLLAAALLCVSAFVIHTWFSAPLLTRNLRAGLQRANGATVDLERASVELTAGQVRIRGLAIADKKQLDKDLFAADELVGTIDMDELLRRRFVIDELRATRARAGTGRAVPGEVLPRTRPELTEPAPPAEVKTIDDYLAQYEEWKARLEQLQDWLEVLSGDDEAEPRTPAEQKQRREVEEATLGLARVAADHLRQEAPRFLIRRIAIEGIDCSLGGERRRYDLRASNVSPKPALLPQPMQLGLLEQSDRSRFELRGPTRDSAALGFAFALRELPVDALFGSLRLQGKPALRGGSFDLSSDGAIVRQRGAPLQINLPVQLALRDTTFALAGARETKVEQLVMPVGLRGSITRPAVLLDDMLLRDALLQAGKQELANFVQQHAGALLGRLPAGLQGSLDLTKSPAQIQQDLEAAALQQVDEAKQRAAAEAARLEAEARQQLDARKQQLDAEQARLAEEATRAAQEAQQQLEAAQQRAAAEAQRLQAEAEAAKRKLEAEAEAAKRKAEAEARQKLEAEARRILPGGLPGVRPGGK